jgi:molecular chaperone DnaK
VPQIEVAFDIDANGIVNVSAKDLATGKEQQMTITGGTALSKDDIAKMQKDAEAFAAEDHKRRESAEARNQGDSLTYQIDKAISEYGDKVPAEEKAAVEQANTDLKEALKGDDVDRIKQATEAATAAFQRIGQAMYAQQQASQAQAAAGGGSSGPGEGGVSGDGDGDAGAGEPEAHKHGEDDVVEGEIVE